MRATPGRCEWCLYWRRYDDDVGPNGVNQESSGGCYRHPPRVFPVTGDMGQTLRIETHSPMMRDDDFCGEFTEGPNCPAEAPKETEQ